MNESILEEAQRLTHGERNNEAGDPYENHRHIKDIFNAITGQSLTASDAAIFMLCVKLSREQTSQKRDHYVDLAGYAWVLSECRRGEAA